jgi:hypothetical protein
MKYCSLFAAILANLLFMPLLGIGQSTQNNRSPLQRVGTIRDELRVVTMTRTESMATFGAEQRGKEKLATELVAQKPTSRLGEPILISVRATNASPEAAQVDRCVTEFNCFEVTGPDGLIMPDVGYDGQVLMNYATVQPYSNFTIADSIDLTDYYIFQKSGLYSVRFIGRGELADSRAISIEITPGQLADYDQVALSLISVLPEGWRLVKHRSRGDVTPPGWSSVPGKSLHLCHNHMQGEAVDVCLTRAEAKTDPTASRVSKAKDLGRVCGLFVYAEVDKNTPRLWPTAIEDISRALQTIKQ